MVMSFPGEAAIHFLKRWKVGKVLAAGRILFFFFGGGEDSCRVLWDRENASSGG